MGTHSAWPNGLSYQKQEIVLLFTTGCVVPNLTTRSLFILSKKKKKKFMLEWHLLCRESRIDVY